MLNSFARFPDEYPELVARLYDRREQALMLYDGILALLATRDADLARTQVRAALEAHDADWLERNAPSGDDVAKPRAETPKKPAATKPRKKP